MAIKTYVYKTVGDNQELEADVHFSETKPGVPAPVAFVTHGGGYCAGGKEHIPRNQFETLLELGFVAVSVNYRLCPTISLYDGPVTDSKDCYAWCKSTLPALLEQDVGVSIDPRRMVAMGHSAGGSLALLMATNPEPPLAILDFYGGKYFEDEFWHTPNPKLPPVNFPEELINQIWLEVPPPSTTMIKQSELADEKSASNLPKPRDAWLFSAITNGTLKKIVVGDGRNDRVDPAAFFSETFPPVFFIHGKEDRVVPARFTEKAYADLSAMGVTTELRLIDGHDHAYDEKVAKEDDDFAVIREGLQFLAKHASADQSPST